MENIIWSTGHALKIDNITDSDNCFLYDQEGRRYIDMESGVWCTCLGHNNKRINSVITTQINKISHIGFNYCHPQIFKTAQTVLEITGIENGKCEFLSSGSEAVEYGMRAARTVSGKPLALTFSDSYFGAYGDAAKKSSDCWHLYNWLECSCNTPTKGCVGECEEFQGIPFDRIGIFLFEPGSSSGLVRFPSKELIARIYEKIKDGNGIVMVNEITTGMGRTGKWFGYQHYNMVPDIVAMGKGIGNGYPVSVTVLSGEFSERLKGKGFHYAQSHQNDPLGAIVISEVIDIFREDNMLGQCNQKGEYLLGKLNQLKRDNQQIKEIRARGLMMAIEFTHDSMFYFEELLKRGFLLAKRANAEVLRIDPALTIDIATIDLFINALSEIKKTSLIK